MKTRLFVLLMVLCSTISFSYAYDFKYGDLYYYDITDSTAAVARGNRKEYKLLRDTIVIPEKVIGSQHWESTGVTITKEYKVTCISDSAFADCVGVTSFVIPNSVTSIGAIAFRGCTGLDSIAIPNSVTSIGWEAFYGCTGLDFIAIPNSVTEIPWGIFKNCTSLSSVTIPNSVTRIYNEAFYNTKLTSVTIPSSVIYIGSNAFYSRYPTLTSMVLNTKLIRHTLVGIGAYYITTLTIGNGIDSIPDHLCKESSRLTSVTIPNSITSIGNYAFYGCKGLNSISIPNSVTSIGNYAFYGCKGLNSIAIPNNVTSIGDYAFYGCTGLDFIAIPNSVTNIGDYAFSGCTGLDSIAISNRITTISMAAFSDCTGLTSITIPENVTTIEGAAFRGCTGLTSITIPDNVTNFVGWYVFSGCTNLKIIFESCVPPTGLPKATEAQVVHIPFGSLKDYTVQYGFPPSTYIPWLIEPTLNVSVAIADSAKGTIQVDSLCNEAILTATPSEHCHFIQWSDGNADNPRTMLVTNDTTFTAEFAVDTYNITTLVDSTMGTVSGGGTYEYGTRIKLKAVANDGYKFSHWSNGSGFNPYYFTATEDLTLEAFFIPATAVENVNADKADGVQKVLRDGQVFILRNGKTYNTIGLEVE